MASADDERTVGGERRRGDPAAAPAFVQSAGDTWIAATGYAIAQACAHRDPVAQVGLLQVAAEYEGTTCGLDARGGPCAPVRCPLAVLAGQTLRANLQSTIVNSVASKLEAGARRLFGKRPARPDGPVS